jgi:dihydroflavonol-4-reductase
MHVVLTGATGFLGNNVLRLLLQGNHRVTCLVRQSQVPESLAGLSAELLRCDLASRQLEKLLPQDFETLIHCAAQIQIGRAKLTESRESNVVTTANLAAICRAKSRRMLHVSTVDTLAFSTSGSPRSENDREPGKPPATYVVTKKEAERAFYHELKQGLDGVIVHPGFMLGRFDWKPSSAEMMLSVAKLKPPFAPAGGASVADVRDVAQGIVSAITQGRTGENYILGGHNVSYLDLWQRMAKTIGCRAPRFPLPNWLARAGGRAGDLKAFVTRNETNLNSMAAAMGQLQHYYSSGKAIEELGYTLRPLDEAIEQCWEWIKERGWV